MKSKFLSAIAAVVALVGVSSAASAQDGRRFNWSGIYFGAGVGNVSSSASWTFINGSGTLSGSTSDAILALHAGYQHQFKGGLVLGVETSYGRTLGVSFGGTSCPNAAFNCVGHLDDVFTLGGRMGMGIDNLLIYGSAGYAQANVSSQGNPVGGGAAVEPLSRTHVGAYYGGGLDYALTKAFSVGVDYKHLDLSSANHCPSQACTGGNARSVNPDADVVTARFSYKFN